MKSGKPIFYTSADSVLQIAAHEETFGLERLYALCRLARRLCDPLRIGRIIARPAIREAWAKQGAVPMTMTPAEFGVYLEKDIAKWADVIKKADIKLQ